MSSTKQRRANGGTAPKNVNQKPKKEKVIKAGFFWSFISLVSMIVLPICIYYCWSCVENYQGKFVLPNEWTLDGVKEFFFVVIYEPFLSHAVPDARAWSVYLIWLTFQAILFYFAPGPIGFGLPLTNGKRLAYKYNGQFAWFTTLIAVAVLHYTGVFKLTEMYDLFAKLLTICHIVCFGLIAILYLWAQISHGFDRPSDSILYDYFMGPILNPRIGSFDIKFFFELRPGIMHWFFCSLGLAMKQYEVYGTVSTPMLLIVFYHLCFVNACYKGEHHVPNTMDIVYEKFGWMLIWLDIVVVPFIFPLQAYYLLKIGPFEHHWAFTLFVATMHIVGYWIFDSSNSQKDYFRQKPEDHIPNGFPNVPWSKLHNPKYLNTKRGTKLLIDGWWKYARHMNYLGDMMMSWAWGMTCGFGSYFPFAYTTYLTPLLIHRERRDNRDCEAKYGDDWKRYCEKVPYRIIPYIY